MLLNIIDIQNAVATLCHMTNKDCSEVADEVLSTLGSGNLVTVARVVEGRFVEFNVPDYYNEPYKYHTVAIAHSKIGSVVVDCTMPEKQVLMYNDYFRMLARENQCEDKDFIVYTGYRGAEICSAVFANSIPHSKSNLFTKSFIL